MTTQGQITVPKAVRDDLGARPGDELEFEKTDLGFIVRHRPRTSVLDLAGLAAGTVRHLPATAAELDELISAEWSAAALRKEQRLVERRHSPERR